jgi:hypothetical protein
MQLTEIAQNLKAPVPGTLLCLVVLGPLALEGANGVLTIPTVLEAGIRIVGAVAATQVVLWMKDRRKWASKDYASYTSLLSLDSASRLSAHEARVGKERVGKAETRTFREFGTLSLWTAMGVFGAGLLTAVAGLHAAQGVTSLVDLLVLVSRPDIGWPAYATTIFAMVYTALNSPDELPKTPQS